MKVNVGGREVHDRSQKCHGKLKGLFKLIQFLASLLDGQRILKGHGSPTDRITGGSVLHLHRESL